MMIRMMMITTMMIHMMMTTTDDDSYDDYDYDDAYDDSYDDDYDYDDTDDLYDSDHTGAAFGIHVNESVSELPEDIDTISCSYELSICKPGKPAVKA